MSDNALMIGQQELVGTKVKAKNKLGQNAYQGQSSDLPGKHSHIDGFLKQVTAPKTAGGFQMRTVSDAPIKPAHGMGAAQPADPAILKKK